MKFRNANWVIENYLYYIFSKCDLTPVSSKLLLFLSLLLASYFRIEHRNAWDSQVFFYICKHIPEAPDTQKFTLVGEMRGLQLANFF